VGVRLARKQKPVHYRVGFSSGLGDLVFKGLMVAFFVSGAGVLVWVLAAGPHRELGFEVFFLVACIGLATWSVQDFGSAARPVVTLTREAVRIPRSMLRTSVIPVGAVAGVGLVFSRPPGALNMPDAWGLMILETDGRPHLVPVVYLIGGHSSGEDDAGLRASYLLTPDSKASLPRKWFYRSHFDPVTETDTGKLAATTPGQVATDLYKRILARQGPSGPLAVMQLQKHLPADSAQPPLNLIAFWSPDGEIGYPGKDPYQFEPG
jgi:hypothetical protein